MITHSINSGRMVWAKNRKEAHDIALTFSKSLSKPCDVRVDVTGLEGEYRGPGGRWESLKEYKVDFVFEAEGDSCPNCARPLPPAGTARCPDCGEPLTRQARLREAVGEEKTE